MRNTVDKIGTTQIALPQSRQIVKTNGKSEERHVTISPPKIERATFKIVGTAPLVIHRFSAKAKNMMLDKMKEGSTAKKGKKREPLDTEASYNAARYISPEGWDGFNVASIRCGLISACRLVGFKMTLAKLSLFVEADGRDTTEPEFGLIRIHGTPRKLESVARVETGQAYVTIRPCYDEWSAEIKVRYDSEQFTMQDVANLLSRVGEQVGIGEGRPDSKNSAGMGWGTFSLES
jgi:hypothetical protein